VSALGPANAWRCPQLTEVAFSGACGGESCCWRVALCGPLTQRSSTATPGASDSGTAGDSDAGDSDGSADEQTCCYYVEEICGV